MFSMYENFFYIWELIRAINTPLENRKGLSRINVEDREMKGQKWRGKRVAKVNEYTSPLILLILDRKIERETIAGGGSARGAVWASVTLQHCASSNQKFGKSSAFRYVRHVTGPRYEGSLPFHNRFEWNWKHFSTATSTYVNS